MKNKKVLSTLIVVFLLVSMIGILFTTEVMGQPYSGDIFVTDDEGGAKTDFLEGEHLFFTVELNRTEEIELQVSLRDAQDTPRENKIITIEDGLYRSYEEENYFDLTDRRAGEYYLRVSYEGDEIARENFTILSNYASGTEMTTSRDAERTEESEFFVRGESTFINGTVKDARDVPLENGEITARWLDNGDVHHTVTIWTNEDGEFEGEFDWQPWYTPAAPNVGEYTIDLVYDYGGDFEPDTIVETEVTVYEQNFTDNSEISTWTSDEYEARTDHYTLGKTVYYRFEMIDQHGYPPANDREVRVYVQKRGEDLEHEHNRWVFNGILEDEFDVPEEEGVYDIFVYDHPASETSYAETSFTAVLIDIDIIPSDLEFYTQGQTIGIEIGSNLPYEFDLSITDSLTEPYEVLPGAQWPGESFVNEFWGASYTIRSDTPDGTYYIVLNRSSDGDYIYSREFEVKRFDLDVDTNKEVYLPGEVVRAYYVVEDILDGRPTSGVTVEWRTTYRDTDDNEQILQGSTTEGRFSFTLPGDARTQQIFTIEIWANHTGGFSDFVMITRRVGEIRTQVVTDSDRYIPGQIVYIEVVTSVRYDHWTRDILPGAEVEIEISKDGEVLDGYTRVTTTDRSGYRTVGIRLAGDAEPGTYHVRANGTRFDFYHESETTFTVVEEHRNLEVHLRTDKRGNDYYPGERVTVYYNITLDGETVTDANVKYHLRNSRETINYAFATDGRIEFTIPSDYNPDKSGNYIVSVYARLDQETSGVNQISVPVRMGWILLNADRAEYVSGDIITFNYELLHITEGAISSVEYWVTNAQGDIVDMGTPQEGEFTYAVPEYPSGSYTGRIRILTTGGIEINAQRRVTERAGYYIVLEEISESDYVTGVYKPGQRIRFRYEIVPRGDRALPEVIDLNYGILNGDYMKTIRTNEVSGTIDIIIPSHLVDGEYILMVDTGVAETMTIFEVENEPSWTEKNSPISGVGQFGFLVFILVIIALVIGILATILIFYNRGGATVGSYTGESEIDEYEEEPPQTFDEEPSPGEYVIEDGEPEPVDQWHEESGDISDLDEDDIQEW